MIQNIFYILSPLVALLAVYVAYQALFKQSKPLILVYYEPNDTIQSVIDLVICNHGNGTARRIIFSESLPINCWGIEAPDKIDKSAFIDDIIPVLAAGKELRYPGGQYGGLLSIIGNNNKIIKANYEFKSPLKFNKQGQDTSILDIRYIRRMSFFNTAANDLSDAMKGRNQTVFAQMNTTFDSINKSLNEIVKHIKNGEEK